VYFYCSTPRLAPIAVFSSEFYLPKDCWKKFFCQAELPLIQSTENPPENIHVVKCNLYYFNGMLTEQTVCE